MPELPEVETISSQLQKKIPGRTIRDVWSDWPKILQVVSHKDHLKIKKTRKDVKKSELGRIFERFKQDLVGRKIKSVGRIGKNITIDLSGDHIVLVHQKLTGHLLFGKWNIKNGIPKPVKRGILDDKINGYIHLIFFLSGGEMIALSDLRKFAKVVSGPKEKVFSLPEIANLGPDPLEKGFTFEKFRSLIIKEKGPIKNILLDQEVFVGIGNIYSDEILWAAGVHPLEKAGNISGKKLEKMYNEMRNILAFSIKLRGDSMSDFRDIYGERGGYQNHHKAYQKEDEPCQRCQTKIKRIKVAGRSAHFCPKCQILKK